MTFGKIGARPMVKPRTAGDYVRGGLVAMWDGIEHGDDPLVWSDASGNGWDATQRVDNVGWRWDADCYTGTTGNGHGFKTPSSLANVIRDNINGHTIETVYKPLNTRRQTIFGQYNGGTGARGGLNIEYSPHLVGFFRAYYDNAPNIVSQAWKTHGQVRMTCSVVCDGTHLNIFENGDFTVQGAQPTLSRISGNQLVIGGENSRSAMSIIGELCAVRIYSRALTAEEIAYNYNIDKMRFNLS